MAEHEKRIREALEAGPTDGPWSSEVDDTNPNELNIISNNRPYVATAWPADASNDREQEANAAYIAACNPSAIRALLSDLDAMRAIEDEVRHLLWGTHPECCGRPCVGAEYMGQCEMVCCGEFDSDTLSDAQIVVSLRARFPQEIDALKGASA